MNSDFDDIADALTDSLSRTGDGGMQAALPLNIAGFFYSGDANTGIKRPDPDTQVIFCGGVDVVEVTPTGASILGVPLIAMPIGAVMMWSGSSAPTGWIFPGTYNRADYPDLWAFAATEIGLGNTFYGNGNGATTFTIGTMDGYAPVGVDAGGTTLPGVTHIGDTTGDHEVTLAANQIPSITSVNAAQPISVVSTTNELRNVALSSRPPGGGAANDVYTGSIGPATSTGNNSISVAYTNASQQDVPIVQPSRAFKFIIYAGV